MINYQYYHTGREYKINLNLESGSAEYSKYENIFEKLRTAIDGNAFTYATTNEGGWVMLQSVQDNVNFAEGFSAPYGALYAYPSEYAGCLAGAPYDGQSFISPDVMLPCATAGMGYPALARELAPFFGQIADALIYGDPSKQIVISSPLINALDYLRVIGTLFPTEFMKRVGFSLGAKRVPETKFTFYNNDRTNTDLCLRISVSDYSQYDFSMLSSANYFFDAFSGRHGYQANLSTIGTQIANSEPEEYYKWAEIIARSTDSEGNIDRNRLEALTAQAIFMNERTKENARKVISKISYSLGEYEAEARDAIAVLLEENDDRTDSGDVALVDLVRSQDQRIARATEESYRAYLCRKFEYLDDSAKEQLMQFLINDQSGNGFAYFIDCARDTVAEDDYRVFDFIYALFERLVRENRINTYTEWIRKAIDYFDIQNWFGRLTAEEQHSGEKFFSILARKSNRDTVWYIAAMILATAYSRNCAASDRAVRVAGLRTLLDTIYSRNEAKDKLLCVANIRILIIMFDSLRLIENFDSSFNFVYDVEAGDRWMKDNIRNLSFDEKMRLYLDFLQGRNVAYPYEGIKNDLKSHLLNFDEVRVNVVAGEQSERIYGTVFASFSPNERSAAADIGSFLRQLREEMVINVEFVSARQEYIKEAYATLPTNAKKKYFGSADKESLFEGKNFYEQAEISKDVDNIISVNPAKPRSFWEKVKDFLKDNVKAFISAAVAAIASVLIIMLLPLAKAVVLDDMSQFMEKLKLVPAFAWLFPVACATMNGLFYALLHRDPLRRSILYTLFCGIIPEFMFVVSIFLVYCIGWMF